MSKVKSISAMFLALTIIFVALPLTVNAEDSSIPTLDSDGYYAIYNADQLYWFAEQVDAGNTTINGKLMNDITVNTNVLVDGKLNSDADVVAAFRAWNPIGYFNSTSDKIEYSGIFDGCNHTISGLYFSDASTSSVGLFARTNGATVKNVGIIDTYFSAYAGIGGVVGYNNGLIENCFNAGYMQNIYENGLCGGIAGSTQKNSKIINCYNSGYIVGDGGVVGWNSGLVQNCYNVGMVVSDEICVGGIAGSSDGEIVNCYNVGDVTSTSRVIGGIVGQNASAKVLNCYNTGAVTGTYQIGGIAGYSINESVLENCYNTGTVTGKSYNVGGVAGYIGGMTSCAVNCYYLSDCAVDGNGTKQYGVGNKTTGEYTADTDGATEAMSFEEFESGKVAYLLNSGVTDGTQAFYQNIDNGETVDNIPVLDNTHGTVYLSSNAQNTYTNSNGSGSAIVKTSYTNADMWFTVTYPAEIIVPWGSKNNISVDYSVQTRLGANQQLKVTVACKDGKNLLTNAEMTAKGYNGISISDIQNPEKTFPELTGSVVKTTDVYFNVPEASWIGIPITEYSTIFTYTAEII